MDQFTSITVWVLLLPGLPGYLLGTVVLWLLHVSGMVVLRMGAYALIGETCRFGGTLAHWLFELVKDVQTVQVLVCSAHALAWYDRARRGEAQLVARGDEAMQPGPVGPDERPRHFLVRKLGKDFLVDTADIEYAQAAGNYVNLHVRGHDSPLRITMAALRDRLDGAVFLPTHRSWLVNRQFLVVIEPLDGGEAGC